MSDARSRFIDRCLAGEALADDVDDYVDLWHEGKGDTDTSLAEFLGFTDIEYRLWAEKPHMLPFILNARRNGIPISIGRTYDDQYRLAARGLPIEAVEELNRWLKMAGELPT